MAFNDRYDRRSGRHGHRKEEVNTMSNFISRSTAATAAMLVIGGCQRAPAPQASPPPPTVAGTVFTDSVLHAQKCAPVKQGEDWRKVCTPLDQSLFIRKRR